MSSEDKSDESAAAAGPSCETAETWREAAEECCAAGTEKMRKAAENVEDYVRREPVKSLLIAAGVGFLAGLLVIRRK